MKRIHGIAVATLALAAAPLAQAQIYGPEDEGLRFSDGTRVVCEKVETHRAQGDPNRIAGTAVGAVVGGLLGSQVGSGRGRDLATVGGAVVGGALGRNIQGDVQERKGERVVEKRCERVLP